MNVVGITALCLVLTTTTSKAVLKLHGQEVVVDI